MADKIYPKGIRIFKPREGAPDWVLGTMIVTPSELEQWVKDNQQYMSDYNGTAQLKCDLLKGKDGPYIAVNTYKPANTQTTGNGTSEETKGAAEIDINDGLPF